MIGRIANTIKAVSIKHLFFILLLSFVLICSFIYLGENQTLRFLDGYFRKTLFIFSCISSLFIIFIALSLCFKKEVKLSLAYTTITLTPILLLQFWRPDKISLPIFFPLLIIISTQIIFFIILSRPAEYIKTGILTQRLSIFLFSIFYFIYFSYLATQKYNSFSFFNSKDFAIYNQTFWNSIRGMFFQNSTYGSNFACHNSVFFFLLLPFYYALPHPLTLVILKILLLTLSAIPFYLIAKHIVDDSSILPLTMTFLLYPFILSQNLIPPHEITYAPFFILFTYYFFKTNRFLPFAIFLILSVSIKEHLSLLAVMFGIFSFFQKKSKKWILFPILLGSAWAIFSLLIIHYFQSLYLPHPDAAWFLTNLKIRLSLKNGDISLASLISSSNLGSWYKLKHISLLFSPLGIIIPLTNCIWLLGAPELFINLLADRPSLFSIPWHYNVITSCFLLIATVQGVKKISDWKIFGGLSITKNTVTLLLSVFILSATLIHSYLWLELTSLKTNKAYNQAVNEALRLVPKDAYISVPRNIAVHVSDRAKYSLIDEKKYGDFVLLDSYTPGYITEDDSLNRHYENIFRKDKIILLKKHN